jgi:hypothetical protein
MGAVCRPQIFDGELPPAAFGNRLDKWVLGGPTEQLALVVFPQFRDEIHKDSGGCSSDTTSSRDLTKRCIMTTQVAAMRGHALAAEVTPI